MNQFIAAGGNKEENIPYALKKSDTAITMLPSGNHVKKIYMGDDGIINNADNNLLLIDSSTIDVETSREVEKDANENNLKMLDAPVSGGVTGAEAGTLTFMVGGEEEAYNKVEYLFGIMGQKSVLCGKSGAGQSAKICNNMILGISMIGVCESFNLAEKLNLNWERLYDVVSTSSGSCWSVNTYCPAPGIGPESPADRNYQPGFAADLMLKDLKLAKAAAESVDAPTALGRHATEIYETFLENGGKGMDFSAILPYLAKKL